MVQARVYDADQAPNHCLVNEYLLGAGIPPHQARCVVGTSDLIMPRPSNENTMTLTAYFTMLFLDSTNVHGFYTTILPQDGALYSPCVATITLEGPAMMEFHRVNDGYSVRSESPPPFLRSHPSKYKLPRIVDAPNYLL